MKQLADNMTVDAEITAVRLSKKEARIIEARFERKAREVKIPIVVRDKPMRNGLSKETARMLEGLV